MKEVVVVVLCWNKPDAVIDCVHRVKALVGAEVRPVVVDNGSVGDTVVRIREAHPDITILEEPVNSGFVGGVNRGLAEAARRDADYAWLLNDDTTFDADILVPMLAEAERPTAGGTWSPLLLDLGPASGDQFRNGLVDWKRGVMSHNVPGPWFEERVAAGATPIVPGTAMLIDLRVYRAIGPFDPRFFAYWEDTDYAVRTAAAGFGNVVVAGARMQHAATPDRTTRPPYYHYYMVRNEALFWRLHGRRFGAGGWRRRWLHATLDWIGEARAAGRIDNANALIDGVWDAWAGRTGPRPDRAPAPRWFAALLLRRTYLLATLLRGDVGAVLRRIARR